VSSSGRFDDIFALGNKVSAWVGAALGLALVVLGLASDEPSSEGAGVLFSLVAIPPVGALLGVAVWWMLYLGYGLLLLALGAIHEVSEWLLERLSPKD
jgi:hypothetical protein